MCDRRGSRDRQQRVHPVQLPRHTRRPGRSTASCRCADRQRRGVPDRRCGRLRCDDLGDRTDQAVAEQSHGHLFVDSGMSRMRAIRQRLTSETGMSLIEVTIACAILLVVMSGPDGDGSARDVDHGEPGPPRGAHDRVCRGQDGADAGAHLWRRPEQHHRLSVSEHRRHRAGGWRQLRPGRAGGRLCRLPGSKRQRAVHRRHAVYGDSAGDLVLQTRVAGLDPVAEPEADHARPRSSRPASPARSSRSRRYRPSRQTVPRDAEALAGQSIAGFAGGLLAGRTADRRHHSPDHLERRHLRADADDPLTAHDLEPHAAACRRPQRNRAAAAGSRPGGTDCAAGNRNAGRSGRGRSAVGRRADQWRRAGDDVGFLRRRAAGHRRRRAGSMCGDVCPARRPSW